MIPHSKRVLCAEDDQETSSMLSNLLGLINLEVVTAMTFAEARDKIESEPFDLYLLDNWLPGGGSGVELCKIIRETEKDAPVLFYSGAAYHSDREEAIKAGAQAYLIKPSDIGMLVETVKRLLRML